MIRSTRSVAALLALLVTVGGSTAAAARARTHDTVACSGYGHAVLEYPILSAIGSFRCSTGAASATATLVLQGFERGKWITIESATITVHARPHARYVLRTRPIHCSATPRKIDVRTTFRLVAGPLILATPPSGRLPTLCIG